jgi:Alw26I/Eco31I/Esp3I family type II restriction m6 adenine DNA methyltransferase
MSTHHLDLLHNQGGVDNLGRSLLDRAAGRFYTPELIGRRLAEAVLASGVPHRSIRVVDPFCGDGRLLSWLLAADAPSGSIRAIDWELELWDIDAEAVRVAKEQVALAAKQAGIHAAVRAVVVDTFSYAPSQFGSFDIVVTNPPWDLLKPDKRELAMLTTEAAALYVATLRARSNQLVAQYPTSLPGFRFSGWGVNLARCGAEVALRLAGVNGVCGVVSPASLLGDQASAELRRWMFSAFDLRTIDYYPAETRLFKGVDQPAIAFVAVRDSVAKQDIVVSRFASNRDVIEQWRHVGDAAESDGFPLPIVLGADASRILGRIRHLPRFRDLESATQPGLWAGRELDETGLQTFLSTDGPYPFAKGRTITRYGIAQWPAQSVIASARRIPQSSQFARIAWRDVSRPSQRRRMQATIIPEGWVTGNSLSVAHFRDGDEGRLKALLAVLNSAVFEYQIRALLATAHVSLSTVRVCHLPELDAPTTIQLASLVDERLAGDVAVEMMIDAIVAECYGVSDELDAIQSTLSGVRPLVLKAAS